MNSTMKYLSAFLLSISLAEYASAADNVTLQISGKIIASPCTTINGGVNPLVVPLGDNIPASSLASAGSNSSAVEFDLPLTGCPSGTSNIKATFTGTPDVNAPDRWFNMAASPATGTAVELRDKATSVLISNGSVLTAPVSSNKATFRLKASAYSKSGGALPGDVSTVIVASFVYQ